MSLNAFSTALTYNYVVPSVTLSVYHVLVQTVWATLGTFV